MCAIPVILIMTAGPSLPITTCVMVVVVCCCFLFPPTPDGESYLPYAPCNGVCMSAILAIDSRVCFLAIGNAWNTLGSEYCTPTSA